MPRTGRPRKPTAIHILNGNPSRRALPANEPRPRADKIRCPSWLDRDAKHEWRQRGPEQIAIGVLTNADVMSFAGYCQAVSDIQRLKAFLDENGTSLVTDKGSYTYPEVKMLENAWARLRGFASDFGMNPSARSRISVAGPKESALDALLG